MVNGNDYTGVDYSDTTITHEGMYREADEALINSEEELFKKEVKNTIERIECVLDNGKNLGGNIIELKQWIINSQHDLKQIENKGFEQFRKEYLGE